jgi:tetratricopeptide (TPR) repeat protein
MEAKMMNAEDHYLDAIAAEDEGDIEGALESARAAVKADPSHAESWWMISSLELSDKSQADLGRASRSLTACRKVVALEPSRVDAWVRGGRLMADELGLYEDALFWWQECREVAPFESVPLVEQAAILTDMGFYDKAMDRLATIQEENLDVGTAQFTRISRLHALVSKAAEQDEGNHFRPWEKNHNGWNAIHSRRNKGPVSENLIFMMTTVPFLMMEVFISRALFGDGWTGFCLTSLMILITVIMGMRFTRGLFQKVNRPAFNLLRAMDFEASTAKLVIPDDVRDSRLYLFLVGRRARAYQERYSKIVLAGKPLPRNWKPRLPDFDSHLDEIGIIEEGDDSNELPGFEEE